MMSMISRNIFASGTSAIARTRLVAAAATASSASARARLSTTARACAPSQQHHNNHNHNGGVANDHSMSPQELLDSMHPKRHGEVLSSMLDGELDYDTDMGAASVNNVAAEKRAEANKKAEKIARDTYDDFAKRHF